MQLDLAVGGRAVEGASDPLNHRRTVYGLVDRQDLPAFYRAFDFAVPDPCAERRSSMTVPQQALFALNSAFIMDQARALAREPTKAETAAGLRFVEAAATVPETEDALTPWEQFAQVLLATNELLFWD